jgi:hypothetical protein
MSLALVLVMALGAGVSMSLGALVSANTRLRARCLQHEIDSFVAYFGGVAWPSPFEPRFAPATN